MKLRNSAMYFALAAAVGAAGCEVETEEDVPEVQIDEGAPNVEIEEAEVPDVDVDVEDAPDVDVDPGTVSVEDDNVTIDAPDVETDPDANESG